MSDLKIKVNGVELSVFTLYIKGYRKLISIYSSVGGILMAAAFFFDKYYNLQNLLFLMSGWCFSSTNHYYKIMMQLKFLEKIPNKDIRIDVNDIKKDS